MLTGEYRNNLDVKGRVFIPAKFRADLGQNVTVAKTFGENLVLYSEEEWQKFVEKLDDLCSEGVISEKMLRAVMRSAMTSEVDAQGRINICEKHRTEAQLEKEIVFIGIKNYVEIWSDKLVDADGVSEEEVEDFKHLSRKLHLGLG